MDWAEDVVDEIYIDVGSRIRSARIKQAWNQAELGRNVGLTRSSIANIEAGRQRVLVHSLLRIADSLNVAVESLLPGTDQLHQLTDRPRSAPDLTGQTDAARDFVTSALRRTREGIHGSAETT
ncbi:helix-turn-helix transcriptional regulator [Mycobacterium heidelbergense]|nr:helix-turn-helix transcriptional regulator [Mycobacterium heidelbergense]